MKALPILECHDPVKPLGYVVMWRPIETAPKDGTKIIVAMDGMVVISQWVDDWGWPQLRIQSLATHWMPIPPLP